MNDLVHQLSVNIKSWIFVIHLLVHIVFSILDLHISISFFFNFAFFLDFRLISIFVSFAKIWILSFSFFFGILD